MIALEYFNGKKWEVVDHWHSEALAWVSLGSDNFNYRTVDENGKVLNVSDNFKKPFNFFDKSSPDKQENSEPKNK